MARASYGADGGIRTHEPPTYQVGALTRLSYDGVLCYVPKVRVERTLHRV